MGSRPGDCGLSVVAADGLGEDLWRTYEDGVRLCARTSQATQTKSRPGWARSRPSELRPMRVVSLILIYIGRLSHSLLVWAPDLGRAGLDPAIGHLGFCRIQLAVGIEASCLPCLLHFNFQVLTIAPTFLVCVVVLVVVVYVALHVRDRGRMKRW
jgi:hypothetical protein